MKLSTEPIPSIMAKDEMEKISIYKWENVLPFGMEMFCHLIWKCFGNRTPSVNVYLLLFVKNKR